MCIVKNDYIKCPEETTHMVNERTIYSCFIKHSNMPFNKRSHPGNEYICPEITKFHNLGGSIQVEHLIYSLWQYYISIVSLGQNVSTISMLRYNANTEENIKKQTIKPSIIGHITIMMNVPEEIPSNILGIS